MNSVLSFLWASKLIAWVLVTILGIGALKAAKRPLLSFLKADLPFYYDFLLTLIRRQSKQAPRVAKVTRQVRRQVSRGLAKNLSNQLGYA